jgi:hypothetical protein
MQNRLPEADTPNAVTSADVSTALEPIAVEPSALSRADADLRMIVAGLDGVTSQAEIDFIMAAVKADPRYRDDPPRQLLDAIGRGKGPEIVKWAHRKLAATRRSRDPAREHRSSSCQASDHQLCVWSWCDCPCHQRPA